MKYFLRIANIILLSSMVAACGPAATAETAQEADLARAGDLARLLQDEGSVSQQISASWRANSLDALRQNASLVRIERKSPGTLAEISTAAEPVVISYSLQRLPAFHSTLAKIYASYLTASEINSLLDFWKSPLGQKIRRGGTVANASAETFDKVIESRGEYQLTAQDVGREADLRAQSAVGSLNAQERMEVQKFSQSSAATKLHTVNKEVWGAAARWRDEPDPQMEAAINQVIGSVIQRRREAQNQ